MHAFTYFPIRSLAFSDNAMQFGIDTRTCRAAVRANWVAGNPGTAFRNNYLDFLRCEYSCVLALTCLQLLHCLQLSLSAMWKVELSEDRRMYELVGLAAFCLIYNSTLTQPLNRL
jgi:hypothetical protein